MAIVSAVCSSWKREIISGVHEADDVYKLALYTAAATLGESTTVYSSRNEVPASGGYYAGGGEIKGFSVSGSGPTARLDFDPITFDAATIKARGALIYNSSKGGKAVAVFDFGKDITSTAGPFTVPMPPVGDATSLIRLA